MIKRKIEKYILKEKIKNTAHTKVHLKRVAIDTGKSLGLTAFQRDYRKVKLSRKDVGCNVLIRNDTYAVVCSEDTSIRIHRCQSCKAHESETIHTV